MGLSGEALAALLEDARSRGVSLRFRARGFSMWPFLKDGDVITVGPLPAGGPRVGDVVAFRDPGRDTLLLHRLIARSGRSLRTRGDNEPSPDAPFPSGRLLGRITGAERNQQRLRLGFGPEAAWIGRLSRLGLYPGRLGALARLCKRVLR